MAWLRIDDRVRTHPKIAKAGPSAAWLWLCGVCYCREHLTDGFIPDAAVPALAMNLPSPKKHAARLVEVRLWEAADGGYQVHDFLDWNPSRSEVMSLRDKERDKKRTQRGTTEGHIGDASRAYAGARGSGYGSSSSEMVLEESARETTTMPRGLIDGRDIRAHGEHEWCDWKRRMCVQRRLHLDFVSRLGGEDAEAKLRAWYPTVIARYEGQPIGDDVFAFWRHEFAAWVGTVTAPPQPASGRRTAAQTTIATARRG